jgi:PAS domain S-box-containing protein
MVGIERILRPMIFSDFMSRHMKTAAITISLLLAGMVSYLLFQNYRSQVALYRSSQAQLKFEADRLAIAVGYFFSERKEDIKTLVQSRDLSVFFENKALGMSMAYGLRASLLGVTDRFETLKSSKRMDGDSLFSRILFLNEDAEVFVESGTAQAASDEKKDWHVFLTPNESDPLILPIQEKGELRLVVSAPYFFKNNYAGQILGWLSPDPIYQHLLKPEGASSDRLIGLSCSLDENQPSKEKIFYRGADGALTEGTRSGDDRHGSGASPRGYFNADGRITLKIPIKDTPFSIAMVTAESELNGHGASWHLPLAMGILAMLVIGGIVGLWQFDTRNAILTTRLEETAKKEIAIQEKNIQLEREIEERVGFEEALRESKQRLDLALKGGDLGIWDNDLVTGRKTYDVRWAEMLGYSLEEIHETEQWWEVHLHPKDKDWVLETVSDHLRGETTFYEAEYRLMAKNGDWRWILDRGQVVEKDSQDRPTRVAGTHMDITTRKMTELELKKYQDNLVLMVEMRTQELQQAEKELVNKAMEAGRAQLSAMVLHNIGNAVTPIGVFLSNLDGNRIDESIHYLEKCYEEMRSRGENLSLYLTQDPRGRSVFEFMGKLISSIKQHRTQDQESRGKVSAAVSYISEILTMQQAYAATGQEIKTRTDINALLTDAVHMQESAFEKRGIIVEKEFSPDLPQILIDKNRLMQVAVNIIKNGYEAIDFNPENNTEKRMILRTFYGDGRVGFSISDTGMGVDPEIIHRVFEFGESGKGSSGFGLYYCRMFVEANRGVMTLESPGKGKGATVWVSFEIG